jgi:hypothetical protein
MRAGYLPFRRKIMTRLFLVGCVVLLSTGLVRGELFCAGTPHDAGQVASGKVLQAWFMLVNRGTSVIEVTEVKPGCGCLRPHLDRVTFQPGEHGTLAVEVNALTQAAGPNAWSAVVH